MRFRKDNITILDSLNREEAKVYILFLISEKRRHLADITEIDERIIEVCRKFGLEYEEIEHDYLVFDK